MTEYTFFINGEYKTVEADTEEEALKEQAFKKGMFTISWRLIALETNALSRLSRTRFFSGLNKVIQDCRFKIQDWGG